MHSVLGLPVVRREVGPVRRVIDLPSKKCDPDRRVEFLI